VLRAALALACLALVAGCEVYTPAPPDEIARARYVSEEPPSVTLLSMVNARSGRSAHAALLINGSERVLYDPAGTFSHPDLPRAGDIHYGMSPKFVDYYERYHARFTHFVHAQTVEVDRATADRVLANARAHGQSMKMQCGLAVADVLQPVPPFTEVRRSFFPEAAREDFARIAGVEDHYVYEADIGKNRAWERAELPPQ
jgi:hypothetical protein